ncbi:hypothetical protein NP006_23540, partial [Salmonella enterica]|nr:hypothetical protein [Salmonella enterica]
MVELDEVQETPIDTNEMPSQEPQPIVTQSPRRSDRTRNIPERYESLISESNDVLLIEDEEPTDYEEVLKSSERDSWLGTMKSKMDSMCKPSLELGAPT